MRTTQLIAETTDIESESQIVYSGGVFSVRSREGYDAQVFSMGLHPVVFVSWYGAVAYCNWKSEMEGLSPCYYVGSWERIDPLLNGYRLPTEAEWERAAAWDGSKHWRYATTTDTIDHAYANYHTWNPLGLVDFPYTTPIGWYNGFNLVQLETPGVYTAHAISPVGAYDMCANVEEWCHDWYQYDYYSVSESIDPTGPASGTSRSLRPGACFDQDTNIRAASRKYHLYKSG